MKSLLQRPGLGGLLFAQTQVAFNDNATKLVLIGLVQILLPADAAQGVVSLIALLLVAPFVLFSPLSGWLADAFPKKFVLEASLWLQLAVMGFLFVGMALHSLPLAIGGFFLLGLQSALMSPARRGMVKEVAGDSVGEAVGWMEMLCIAAILGGSLAGGQLIDGLAAAHGPWIAGTVSVTALALLCGISLMVFRKSPVQPAAGNLPFSWKAVGDHAGQLRSLFRNPAIGRAALGDAAFYLAGGFLMLTLTAVGRELFPSGLGAARSTGLMMATLGGGIAVGSVIAARICRNHIQTGLVPFASLGMAAAALCLVFTQPGTAGFSAGLFLLGACGGLYLVPLGAFLVDRAPEAERGNLLAASGMLSSLAGVAAVGAHFGISKIFGTDPRTEFLILSGFFVIVAVFALHMIPAEVLRLAALFLARMRYRVKVEGLDHLPKSGGVLLVCNHVSYVDTLVLSLACPRPIRFLSYAGFFQTPVLGSLLRMFGAVPVSSTRVRDAVKVAAGAIVRGEVVCIFPEGQLTRTGCLLEIKSGFELIARKAGCPVVVAHLDGLWGSIHSFEGGRYFTKWPKGLARRTTVSFAPALDSQSANSARVREILLELGQHAFRNRKDHGSLPRELFSCLQHNALKPVIIDPSSKRPPMNNLSLLIAACALARSWKDLPGRRVGILLPPGIGGTLANLGVLFAGKIPVNLNPAQSGEAFASCLKASGVQVMITAPALLAKFPNLPLPPQIVDLAKCLVDLRGTGLVRGALTALLPGLGGLPGLRRVRKDTETILLFTSGTSGLPKGVPLTHQNVLGNIRQFLETGVLEPGDRLLSCLPLFHSFGLTAGLFLPLISGRTLVTAPSPLDCDAIAAAAREGSPTLLLGTPTFLRQYIKRIPRDAFGSLRMTVAGAEKLPVETAREFQQRFGCEVWEGYGLTEASPLVSLNRANPATGFAADSFQPGNQPGSTGRPLPGVAVRFLDPETRTHIPGSTRGLLALRGINIIASYLDGGQNADRFHEGWFVTGDVARLDDAGFLHLEGRQSRFSKIGGEMVSHAAVEAEILKVVPGETHCVLGCPHPEKGEELALLTTADLSRADLLAKCHIPNLWIPRRVVPVREIPLLASGKLDLAACRKLVQTMETHA